jgi:tellurite methyltransferase
MTLAEKWNAIYQEKSITYEACEVLAAHPFLLPKTGVALDLACGLGANAVRLAQHGLTVYAWDISAVAIEKLQQHVDKQGLNVIAQVVDVQTMPLPENTFDVIVISRFLDRRLCHGIIAALKSKGLLFYQTYTRQKLSSAPPHHPDFLLADNELLTLFSPLKVVYYQEHGLIGDLTAGERNEAFYIGQKP